MKQFENKIFNEKCEETIKKMIEGGQKVDIVLTSPFYNTNYKAGKTRTLKDMNDKYFPYVRYDVLVDNMSDKEYEDFTCSLFDKFNLLVEENGVVLWQISYGALGAQKLIDLMSAIGKRTNFTCADIFTWKKKMALPNSVSMNKCTRITEYIFVFCRKTEYNTFRSNKKVVSIRKNGQKQYSTFPNFIEAKNNDGACNLNKATFSTELVEKLLDCYATDKAVVYDCFMGTGTTAVACKRKGLTYIGSEISEKQCKYAEERINKEEED